MKSIHHEKGATLAISLMLLFVITLLGINSIRTTQLQEKMSHQSQDKIISFSASESASLYAESLLGNLDTEPSVTTGCPNTLTKQGVSFCISDYSNTLIPELQDSAWWATNGQVHELLYPSAVASKNHVNESPRFYIEYIRFVSDSLVIGKSVPSGMYYYRIFSRGNGVTNKSSTFIETTYRRRY